MIRRTSLLILLISLLGGLRVLGFSAAYPPFLFIDESLHWENVVKFSRVGLPGRGDDRLDFEAVRTVAKIGVNGVGAAPGLTPEERQRRVEAEAHRVARYRNCETFAPPLYYALAAAWYRLGHSLGLRDALLVYWVRFLAAPLYAGAIWLACRLCLVAHARRPALAIGVGILLAALPQDVLYTINSDVASPIVVTLALYLLARWMRAERSLPLAAGAGLATAAALLVKYTNVAAPIGLGVVLALRLTARGRGGDATLAPAPPDAQADARSAHAPSVLIARASPGEVAILLLCLSLPLAAWMVRCQVVLGDFSASREKAEMLGWTVQPLSASLRHPIFGPLGMIDFSSRLCATFWRGELVWDNRVQHVAAADTVYFVATALGVLGAIGWLVRPSRDGRAERAAAGVWLAAAGGSVLLLALLSTRYDFGRCFFPSRGFPYFAAGRLLSGAMTPAAIVVVGGFGELLAAAAKRWPRAVLIGPSLAIAMVCLASEVYLCAVPSGKSVAGSPGNFFHVVGRK